MDAFQDRDSLPSSGTFTICTPVSDSMLIPDSKVYIRLSSTKTQHQRNNSRNWEEFMGTLDADANTNTTNNNCKGISNERRICVVCAIEL